MSASLRTPLCNCNFIARQSIRGSHHTRFFSTINTLRSTRSNNPLNSQARKNGEQFAKSRRSIVVSATGMVACAAAMYGLIKLDAFGLNALEKQEKETKHNQATATESKSGAIKLDGPPGFPSDGGSSVIPIEGQEDLEQVATGTSSVPYFPSTIRLPNVSSSDNKQSGDELSADDGEDYQLLGLGIRTVSFLSIQVYVVGLYVAKSDITELQQRLIRTAIHPPDSETAIATSESATSLVSPERQQLKELLMNPERGDAIWSAIIKESGIRTAFRIVPTRNTDFMHMRDSWVRGITTRAQQHKDEFQDQSFGLAMNQFKAIFSGGKAVPKGQAVLLSRNAHGSLDVLFQLDPKQPFRWLGGVTDERISRLQWLLYLAGKKVSSDGARKSIVDGLMMIVERPVGTVTQRVV
ncbi:Chalcone isomerase [Penicillium taxi]|uniref:Chalcone isomerase n=1 Tax=Penicillium taxi TaxID=168475 RepID=UPI0025458B18|nr:Chalcone isomerase [Penicillium taxi]KAJ5889065.1 Chalcone isomerase [Penicillium taxi]